MRTRTHFPSACGVLVHVCMYTWGGGGGGGYNVLHCWCIIVFAKTTIEAAISRNTNMVVFFHSASDYTPSDYTHVGLLSH